ncbi:Globin-3 [Fasciolopsis buskii]|uniref:Globin-3 n=1 Tax=Fasciolopsis buskii TaxID=27845 RepID=A0A8E0S0I8_9TREM|nr:Globin-3 [Fasciolopsis buski]
MAPLTKEEVDALLTELDPLTSDEEKRTTLGLKVYDALFNAKPDYIPLFSKLQGFDNSNVRQSEGIKYYGRTFVDDLLKFIKAAATEAEYENLINESASQHKLRNVNKEQFLSGEDVFISAFKQILKQGQNAASMEKFFKDMIPKVAHKI